MKHFKKIVAAMIVSSVIIAVPATAQKESKLSDPEIASVAVTANQIDIDYAKIAKQRSKNADILKFAQTMTDDHNSIIKQAVDLVTKLKVTPKDNAVSKKLHADAEITEKMLRSKSVKDFDKAYIDNEVTYHEAVIKAVEGLIPQSSNGELKKLLQDVVPLLKAHLGHAEMVQKMFTKK